MGVVGVPGQGWGGGPSWEALGVKQVGAQREGLDCSLKLLWGPHLKAASRSLSPPPLTSPHPPAPRPQPGGPGGRPPREPELLCALGLQVGHAPHLLLDVLCPQLPGPQDPLLVGAHPHPTAPGPRHQAHLPGEVPQKWGDGGADHPAQCHL